MVQMQAPGTGKLQHAFLTVVIAVVADVHVLKELFGSSRVCLLGNIPCILFGDIHGLFQRPPQRVRLVDLLHADQGVHGPFNGLIQTGGTNGEEFVFFFPPVAHHHGYVLSR